MIEQNESPFIRMVYCSDKGAFSLIRKHKLLGGMEGAALAALNKVVLRYLRISILYTNLIRVSHFNSSKFFIILN